MINFGGIGKGVDGVASSIDKIEAKLKSIDKLMESIGKKSDGVGRATKNAASGGAGGGYTVNPNGTITKGNGMSTPTFSAPPQASTNGKASSGAVVVGSFAAATVTTAWGAIPTTSDALGQRQSLFSTTLGMGAQMPDYKAMKTQLNNAFGNYATSSTSQEESAGILAGYGMTMRNGLSSSSQRVIGQASSMSLITGMSQQQAIQTQMNLAKPQAANQMLLMGVNSLNKDGTPKNFSDVVGQVMNRTTMGGKPMTAAEVERGLAPDGFLRRNLELAFGAEGADAAGDYAQIIAKQGGNTNISAAKLEELGLTNEQRSPYSREQRSTAEKSKTTAEYSDNLIKGWDKALDAADKLEETARLLEKTLGPLTQTKGFNETFLQQRSGNALVDGIDQFATGAGGVLTGQWLGKKIAQTGIGGAIMSKFGIGAAGAAGATGAAGTAGAVGTAGAAGTASTGALAAAALPAAGAVAVSAASAFGLKASDNYWNEHGAEEGSGLGARVLSSLGRAASSVMLGGGLSGASTAMQGLISQGWNYGNKQGRGEGTDEKSTKNVADGTPAGATGAVKVAYDAIKGPGRWKGYCEKFVEYCYGTTGVYASATAAWNQTPKGMRHTDKNAPAGALVYWGGGSQGYGHVAISVGGGRMISTDIVRSGYPDLAPIGDVERKWNLPYLGWTPPYFKGSGPTGVADTPDESTAQATATAPSSGGAVTPKSTPNGMSSYAASSNDPYAQRVSSSNVNGLSITAFSLSETFSSQSITDRLNTAGGIAAGGAVGATSDEAGTTRTKAGYESIPETTPGGDPGPTPEGGYTPASWSKALLQSLGVEANDSNLKALTKWVSGEGGHWNNDAKYNPLNTSHNMGNSKTISGNSNNIRIYESWEQGLQASVKTLNNGLYGGIISALQKGNENDIYKAIVTSPWGTTKTSLPYKSEGSWRVDKDRAVNVHEGEMIVPAGEAQKVRDAMAGAMAGQGGVSGGARSVTVNVVLSGNLGYDTRSLVESVKESIEMDSMFSTIGGS